MMPALPDSQLALLKTFFKTFALFRELRPIQIVKLLHTMKTNMHPCLFLNLLWFPIVVTVAVFMTRQAQPGKSTHLTAPKDILQFTSGGHVLGFAKTGVYVASGSPPP